MTGTTPLERRAKRMPNRTSTLSRADFARVAGFGAVLTYEDLQAKGTGPQNRSPMFQVESGTGQGPYKDNVMVAPHMGEETFDFVADTPGEWVLPLPPHLPHGDRHGPRGLV